VVGDHPGRVFISYSRKDGADFGRDLRRALEKENLSFWQDLVALEGGQDWWSQIENALRQKELQHFVLIVTPKALESGVVRQEIRLARQEGKSVGPVRGRGSWTSTSYRAGLAMSTISICRSNGWRSLANFSGTPG
jgi:TIR domain